MCPTKSLAKTEIKHDGQDRQDVPNAIVSNTLNKKLNFYFNALQAKSLLVRLCKNIIFYFNVLQAIASNTS
jgi:hypothetical protein